MLVEARDLGDGVRLLTLNRPPANAINREFNDALCAQCHAARDDDSVRSIIVTGGGKFFSGGMDLKQTAAGTGGIANLAGSDQDGVFALWTMPKPTVAMVNGHAIAGGTILVLACDFRIASRGTHKLGLNEVALGMAFPFGAFEIARLALNNQQLRYATLEGNFLSVDRAHEFGIVDEAVEPEKLETRCVEIAQRLGRNGQIAYAHTKREIQRESVARVLARTPEQIREVNAVLKSDETKALLAAQINSMGSRR
jgi:enoyl-CoA hydratase/carnithine racemase